MWNGLFVWDSLGNNCVFGKIVVGEVCGRRKNVRPKDTRQHRVWETCFLCTLNTILYLQLYCKRKVFWSVALKRNLRKSECVWRNNDGNLWLSFWKRVYPCFLVLQLSAIKTIIWFLFRKAVKSTISFQYWPYVTVSDWATIVVPRKMGFSLRPKKWAWATPFTWSVECNAFENY